MKPKLKMAKQKEPAEERRRRKEEAGGHNKKYIDVCKGNRFHDVCRLSVVVVPVAVAVCYVYALNKFLLPPHLWL